MRVTRTHGIFDKTVRFPRELGAAVASYREIVIQYDRMRLPALKLPLSPPESDNESAFAGRSFPFAGYEGVVTVRSFVAGTAWRGTESLSWIFGDIVTLFRNLH